MKNFQDTLKLVGGALVALVLTPVIALFGLTILGLSIGLAALVTGGVAARVWSQSRDTEEQPVDAEATAEAEAQPA